VLQKLIRFARKSPREKMQSVLYHLEDTDWYWKIHSSGNDRTAYLIGLFGTGGELEPNECRCLRS
jgi:hypothetical protein